MKTLKLSICALAISLCAATLLVGCGELQAPIMTQASTTLPSHLVRATSSDDLLYATGACGGTCVLSYPEGSLVGTLNVGDAAVCSDATGNIYIPNNNDLLEFVHGGKTPINTFALQYGNISACSIDPSSGQVAVVFNQSQEYNVAIFETPGNSSLMYFSGSVAQFCGYDASGNLFVDGYNSAGEFNLSELKAGSSNFVQITVKRNVFAHPGQVQWDGRYMTVQSIGVHQGTSIYRLQLSGSTASVAGTTKFKGISRAASPSWIAGAHVFVPYGSRGNGESKAKIGVWNYPSGGKPLQKITHFEKRPNVQAVTFSAAS